MERAQKERLVGAVVLVSVAWLLIPVFLDQSADGPGETIERRINLPDADAAARESESGRRRTTVALNPPETTSAVPEPQITELPAPGDASVESRASDEDSSEDSTPAAAADWPLVSDTKPADENETQSVSIESAAEDSAVPDDAVPSETPASASVEANAGPVSESAGIGTATIAQEEPQQAETAASSTASDNRKTGTTTSEPVQPAADPVPTTVASGQLWAVQLGSFGDPANARRLAASVREFGMIAFVSEIESNGRTMHRVRIGPQASRAESEAIVGRLRDEGTDARVVAYP